MFVVVIGIREDSAVYPEVQNKLKIMEYKLDTARGFRAVFPLPHDEIKGDVLRHE